MSTATHEVKIAQGGHLIHQITHPGQGLISVTIDDNRPNYLGCWSFYYGDILGEFTVILRAQRFRDVIGNELQGVVHDYVIVREREWTGSYHVMSVVLTLTQDEVDAMTIREFKALFEPLAIIC